MIEAAILLAGILIGYFLCYLSRGSTGRVQAHKSSAEEQDSILVKRSRASLRSPLKTHRTSYDQFKVKDSGLYSPRKPTGKPMKQRDEIEING